MPGAAGARGAANVKHRQRIKAESSKRRKEAFDRYKQEQVRANAWLSDFDTNQSGTLDKVQLKALMQHMNGGKPPVESDVDIIFRLCDVSKTNDLDLHEIANAVSSWKAMMQEQLFFDKLFDKYDTDKSDMLDFDQLKICLKELNEGQEPMDDEVHDLIKEVDVSKTGAVNRDELKPAIERWFIRAQELKVSEATVHPGASSETQGKIKTRACALM